MADSNPEATVREYYELVDAEEYEGLFALFAEDIRYERPGQGAIEGHGSLREFYLEQRPLEDGAHEVHDVIVDENIAAVRGTFSGVQDGTVVEFDFADFHEFVDGKIQRRYTFTDRDEV